MHVCCAPIVLAILWPLHGVFLAHFCLIRIYWTLQGHHKLCHLSGSNWKSHTSRFGTSVRGTHKQHTSDGLIDGPAELGIYLDDIFLRWERRSLELFCFLLPSQWAASVQLQVQQKGFCNWQVLCGIRKSLAKAKREVIYNPTVSYLPTDSFSERHLLNKTILTASERFN